MIWFIPLANFYVLNITQQWKHLINRPNQKTFKPKQANEKEKYKDIAATFIAATL